MTRMQQLGVASAILFSAALPSVAADERYRDANPVISQYFELLSSGNFEIAGDMWAPEALERSSRFGIRYTDIPIKADCNSPIIRLPGHTQGNLLSSIRKYEELDTNAVWYRLEYADVYGSALMKHSYYLQRRGDWMWLGFPQDAYASSWPSVESRYLRVRMHEDARKYVNPVALAEADRFIEQASRRLGIADSTLEAMSRVKIEYFLCPSDSVVEQLTGFRVVGTLDLASNDVISADFPHFHEITHLLVNIRLRELPLYTLPIMREGLATSLAGRWGKHPAPLKDLAVFLYQDSLVALDPIFTMGGFDAESGADMVYPVAGMFAAFLEEKIGMSGLLGLYLQLSGPFDEVNALSADTVHARMAAAAKVADWTALKAEFSAFVERHKNEREMAGAGADKPGKKILSDDRAVVYENGDWLEFEFVAAPGDSLCQGNLIFAFDEALKGKISLLFENQYGEDRPLDGYRYGVRFDQNEAGLYDYAANLLLAKYICGISPTEGYFDPARKSVSVRFRRDILNGAVPEKGRSRMLPM